MTKAQWMIVVVLGIIIACLVMVYQSFDQAQERPAVQRDTARILLQDHARVLAAYRAAHNGTSPQDLPALRRFSKTLGDDQRLSFTSNHVPRTDIFYKYQPPQSDDPHEVIMAAPQPSRAVAAGEADGAKGDIATEDKPAVHILMLNNLTVQAWAPAVLRERAPWVFGEGIQVDREMGAWQ